MKKLIELDLPVRPFFYPLSFLPAFDREKECRKSNPVSYDLSERGICLPSALHLTNDDLDVYSNGIKKILNKKS